MKPEITLLTPRGRLDAAGAQPLEKELAEHVAAGRTHLLVDMSQVTYVSSVGLRVFWTIMERARHNGGTLKLCALTPRVLDTFKLAGFDRILPILATRADAEDSFNVGA